VSDMSRRTRRRRRGIVLAGLALGPLALLAGVLAVRGTWADEGPRLPEHVEDGAVCHVCEPPGQTKHVRCAMLMPFAMEEVWEAITDYEHLGDVCPCLEFGEVRREPDGTCRLKAKAASGLPETVPFALEVRHEQTLYQYVSTWDQPSGHVTVNRGSWTLTAKGPALTLVELAVEVQMDHVPTFILRNINLGRVAETVRGVDQHLRTGSPAKKW
jgi:Polyketide cyclase / dehydrase and lipid transport